MHKKAFHMMLTLILAVMFGAALLIAKSVSAQSSGSSGYHLAETFKIGGAGAWDYLLADPVSHRIFISRGSHTMVVSEDGKVIGDIPKTEGVHGIALAPEFKRGFISDGRANTVTVFDLDSLQTISEIKVTGMNPDSIIYDLSSKRVFTFNGRSGDSTAIDAKTGDVVGTVTLGGKPETGQSDGAGHIYANLEDKSQIVEFDSSSLKVLNTWSIAPCDSPSGLAFDIAHKRLFAGCENKIMAVVDSTNGKVVATVPIGQGVDANGFDPGTGFAFASCGDGTLIVAHEDSPDKYSVVDTLMTQRGARTMTVDTSSHNVYTITAQFGPPAAPTADNPRPRPALVPDSFVLLVFER